MSQAPASPEFGLSPAAGMLAARVFRAPLSLLVSALLARLLGPDGLGAWAMVLAAAMLANQILLLWTQSVTQRFGRSEWLQFQRLDATWALRWPPLLGGWLLIALLLLSTPGEWHVRFYGLADAQRWLVFPALLALWWMGETQGLQQVRARFKAMAWSPLLADAALLAVVAILLVTSGDGTLLGFNDKLVAIALTAAVAWGVLLANELRGMRLRWRRPAREAWPPALMFAAPLVPGYVVGYLAEWCDYLLISHFYDAQEVGLFHAAYQYMLLLIGVPTAVAAVLLPQVVAAMDRGGSDGVRGLVERIAPQLVALWAIATIAVLAVLPWVFAVLTGARFADGQFVLQVLLVAVPGAIASHVYGLAHFAQGRLGVANVGLFGIKLLVNVGISLALLPMLGVIGSAIGSAVSYLVLQWLFLADQHRRLGLALGAGARALALAHAAGVALAFAPAGWWRLMLAAGAIAALMAWIRHSALFTPAEVSALLPARLSGLEPMATRMLCPAR